MEYYSANTWNELVIQKHKGQCIELNGAPPNKSCEIVYEHENVTLFESRVHADQLS